MKRVYKDSDIEFTLDFCCNDIQTATFEFYTDGQEKIVKTDKDIVEGKIFLDSKYINLLTEGVLNFHYNIEISDPQAEDGKRNIINIVQTDYYIKSGNAAEPPVEKDNYYTKTLSNELFAAKSDLPTKTSQLTNDSGYLTEHQDISGKLDKVKIVTGDETTSILDSNTLYVITSSNTFNLYINGLLLGGDEYMIRYKPTTEAACTINLGNREINWMNNETPKLEINKWYEISIMYHIAVCGGGTVY